MAALFYFIQVLGVFLNKNIGLAGGTVLWSVVLYNNRWPVQSPSGTYGRQSVYASLCFSDWAAAIRVAALDCAEKSNHEVCQTYDIHFYPSFRVSTLLPRGSAGPSV